MFTDPTRGVIIGPVSVEEGNRIVFGVALETPSCARYRPALIKNFINPNFVFPDKASLTAGDSGVISMAFANDDYPVCGPSVFRIVPVFPASWTHSMIIGAFPWTTWSAEKDILIKPGDGDDKIINFSVPKSAAPGTYPVGYKVVNVTSGLETEKEFTVTRIFFTAN